MENINQIKCPKCGEVINVSDILAHQVEEKYQMQYAQMQRDFNEKNAVLEKEKTEFQAQKNEENRLFQERMNKQLKVKEEEIKLLLKKQLEEENKERFALLEKELAEKSEKVKETNTLRAELAKLNREKDELATKITADKEKELNDKLLAERQKIQQQREEEKRQAEKLLNEEREKIQQKAAEENQLKIKELEKKLHDQTELAAEMRRKAEQGSMQLQGEVQELAIEEILRQTFRFDKISEVPKGVRGADVVQTVRNKYGAEVGTILYESKRTKNFGNDWISKLKSDAVLVKADVCILVTETMPENFGKMELTEGVWVCSFADFPIIVKVIREYLIKISEAVSSQTNKGEKMQMLYDYLMSNEFVLQIGAIAEGFSELQKGYIQERNQMERIWKQREKQLEKVLLNTNHFIGAIQGIAGSSIRELKQIGSGENLEIANDET